MRQPFYTLYPLVLLLLCPCLILSQGHLRIINGSAARPKQLPYQVALHAYFGNSGDEPSLCGGTILTKRWILTAAHCLQEPDTNLLKVIVTAGALNKTRKDEPGHMELLVRRKDTIVHPLYDRHTVANDIALIRLPKDLKLGAYAQPARLPRGKNKFNLNGRSAISSGWGLTAKQRPTDILQYLNVKIIPNKLCERLWNKQLNGERKLILDSFLCIDSKGGLPCRGDSGGPLVLNDGTQTVVGVVSHGYDDKCQLRLPDIFTRVASFNDWIEQHTGRLSKA
ncbi:brachyurin [Drosophila virilis]|uniref:Peptidase S1 domain-containing protein n=1 Tax=Drosophila virilis TaxID=7244 RepID=B4LHE0_DROVI|nr:chymotrypsin [Drosophila virilis]EDW68470.1 uncharacterized protein Dvir_GJ12687 [Drosophila virilis]